MYETFNPYRFANTMYKTSNPYRFANTMQINRFANTMSRIQCGYYKQICEYNVNRFVNTIHNDYG